MCTALDLVKQYKFFCVIAYSGIQDNQPVYGFINPKLGRFVCTQGIQWATEDWVEAVSLAARYSYEASRCNETAVYQHFVVYGIMPKMGFTFLKGG